MKSPVFAGALILAFGMVSTAAAVTLELSERVVNEINVTSDSSRGWKPTAEQRQHALNAVQAFLDAVEGGRHTEAYGLQNEINKRNETLAQFTQRAQEFKTVAGPLKFWRVLKVTWSKDTARAPFPGIYAAVDLVARFANVDRHCGYMVVYQQPAGGDFTIMRRENSSMDNTTARKIEEKHSRAEVTRLWAELSRHCPNYVFSPDGQ